MHPDSVRKIVTEGRWKYAAAWLALLSLAIVVIDPSSGVLVSLYKSDHGIAQACVLTVMRCWKWFAPITLISMFTIYFVARLPLFTHIVIALLNSCVMMVVGQLAEWLVVLSGTHHGSKIFLPVLCSVVGLSIQLYTDEATRVHQGPYRHHMAFVGLYFVCSAIAIWFRSAKAFGLVASFAAPFCGHVSLMHYWNVPIGRGQVM